MRISDWSSDVCSSDLAGFTSPPVNDGACGALEPKLLIFRIPNPDSRFSTAERLVIPAPLVLRVRRPRHQLLQAAADARDQRGLLVLRRGSRGLRLLVRATGRLGLDRQGVVWGKSVSVRVDLGGRRIIKKKKK